MRNGSDVTEPLDRLLTLDEKEPVFEVVPGWGLPTDPTEFLSWLGQTGIPGESPTAQLVTFMTYPAANYMPQELRVQLGLNSMSGPAPMCYSCVHAWATVESCEAFPNGIPPDVLDWSVDHRKPIDGDNKIVFEQAAYESPFDNEAADSVFNGT